MLKIAGVFEVYAERGEHHWVLRDWDDHIMARNGGYIRVRGIRGAGHVRACREW